MRQKKSNLSLNRKKQSLERLGKQLKRMKQTNSNFNFHLINLNDENFTSTPRRVLYQEKRSKRSRVLSPRICRFATATPSKSPAIKRYRVSASPLHKFQTGTSLDTTAVANKVRTLKPAKLSFQNLQKEAKSDQAEVDGEPFTATKVKGWQLDKSPDENLQKEEGETNVYVHHKLIDLDQLLSSDGTPHFDEKTHVSDSASVDVGLTPENELGSSDKAKKTDLREMIELIPYVIEILHKNELENVFLMFFRQVHENANSVNNIAFLLWVEVVRWFHQRTSVTMRYMDKTKMFWKLGSQLFGGKFLRFMSGNKNKSQQLSGEVKKGLYDPGESEVNFAVPEPAILRSFKPYGSDCTSKGVRKPGIFQDVVEKISPALSGTSCCLTFDGKKLKQGLTETAGDIDLLGFEEGPSLNDRLTELNTELKKQQIVIDALNCSGDSVQAHSEIDLEMDLKQKYTLISKYIQDVTEIKEKKEYALKKFTERGGKDWRQSKFVYVISAIQAFLFDIKNFISKASALLEIISRKLVKMQRSEKNYIIGSFVDRDDINNWIEILELPGDIKDTREIKQHSAEWFSIRQKAKVTGSTIYKALGLEGLKQQKEHFEKVICGIEEPIPSEFAKKAMAHGTKNEKNAVATLVGKFLPVFMPELVPRRRMCSYRRQGG